MAKKKAKRPPVPNRMDAADYGVDVPAVLESIKPHLEGMTQADIGETLGITTMAVSHIMTGFRKPTLGMLAALAKVSGGKLVLKYEPPKKKAKR